MNVSDVLQLPIFRAYTFTLVWYASRWRVVAYTFSVRGFATSFLQWQNTTSGRAGPPNDRCPRLYGETTSVFTPGKKRTPRGILAASFTGFIRRTISYGLDTNRLRVEWRLVHFWSWENNYKNTLLIDLIQYHHFCQNCDRVYILHLDPPTLPDLCSDLFYCPKE